MHNPFKNMTRLEWVLWISSLTMIAIAFLVCWQLDWVVLAACLLGASSLIFNAKGHVIGQFFGIAFALLYGYLSICAQYYGEMITYVFMSMPINIVSIVTWLRHPSKQNASEVETRYLKLWHWILLLIATAAVTGAFYFLLQWFGTANLFFSTISIATSFSASILLLLRCPHYAIAYGCNDIILIILWILAARENPASFPMVVCFLVFLINDTYGFFNWRRMYRRQNGVDKDSQIP